MIRCIPQYQHRFILLLCAYCRTMDCIYLLIFPSCIWCMSVIRASWRPSSSATRMFVWHMVQANIKENTQAPHYCLLRSESSNKGAVMRIVSPWNDVIILYFMITRSLWTATVNANGQSMDLDIIWHGPVIELLMNRAIFHAIFIVRGFIHRCLC